MTELGLVRTLSYAFIGWMALTLLTGLGTRVFVHTYGEPTGWRLNEHAARTVPGHLSFYERDGGHAVVLKPVPVFPMFWTVRLTPEPGQYPNLETEKRAPVWSAVPWAYRWMEDYSILERSAD